MIQQKKTILLYLEELNLSILHDKEQKQMTEPDTREEIV